MSFGDALTAVRRHKAGVLLDTNLLLLLLPGTVDRELIGSWKRTQIYDEDDFDLLSDLGSKLFYWCALRCKRPTKASASWGGWKRPRRA